MSYSLLIPIIESCLTTTYTITSYSLYTSHPIIPVHSSLNTTFQTHRKHRAEQGTGAVGVDNGGICGNEREEVCTPSILKVVWLSDGAEEHGSDAWRGIAGSHVPEVTITTFTGEKGRK